MIGDLFAAAADLRLALRELIRATDDRFRVVEARVRKRKSDLLVYGHTTSRTLLAEIADHVARVGVPVTNELELFDSGDGDATRRATVAAAAVHLRRDPAHTSELRTQAILGESLEWFTDRGDWALVRTGDGYHGWVSRSGIVPEPPGYDPARGGLFARITTSRAPMRAEPDVSAAVVGVALFDSMVLQTEKHRDWFKVETPSGAVGWIAPGDADSREDRPRHSSPAALVRTGLTFIGVPYLWGGSTPLGFDCSGLVQRIFHHHGVLLPRDSDLQHEAMGEVSVNREMNEGDLLFFGARKVNHVAISLGGPRFLHASGWVRVQSLDPDSDDFRPDLAEIFLGSGRVRNFGIETETASQGGE